ncbi:hypothetical protein HIM_11683 [Hirsutella minnesotensis 3608]|uniref:Uncharacterized protein n=1 Tax=Hirsutella minnesotensis 3608 TaxID=1043627 RepID=A0A0F8A0W4_9HYPO|nr:hypothetical protein HIM_11683 [Hirsutella minnesotensis 3608]
MSTGARAGWELRDALLQTKTCWCRNTSLCTDPEGLANLALTETEDRGERFWFTLVFPELSSYRLGRLMEDVSLALPADAWYYGCREDHVCVSKYGHEKVHYCITILLACGRPRTVGEIREGVGKVFSERVLEVSPCPAHLSIEGCLLFEPVATWVQSRIAFIEAVGKGDQQDAVKCAVFGFGGILWVLSRQFGRLSDSLITEMSLAKYFSDEDDDRSDVESAATGGKRGDFRQWTYVRP